MAFSRIPGFSSINIVMFLLSLRRPEGYLSSLVLAVYGFCFGARVDFSFLYVCVCVFCTRVGFTGLRIFPFPLLARSPIVCYVTCPVNCAFFLCLCF